MLPELQRRLSAEELAEAKSRGEALDLAAVVDVVLKTVAAPPLS
jgi:hypothetical protein